MRLPALQTCLHHQRQTLLGTCPSHLLGTHLSSRSPLPAPAGKTSSLTQSAAPTRAARGTATRGSAGTKTKPGIAEEKTGAALSLMDDLEICLDKYCFTNRSQTAHLSVAALTWTRCLQA